MQGNLDSDLQLMGRFHLALNAQNVTKIMTQVSFGESLSDYRLLQVNQVEYSNSSMMYSYLQRRSTSKL